MPIHFTDGTVEHIGNNVFNAFEKADIRHAWKDYGDDKIMFDKKGSEIKALLYSKTYQLKEMIDVCRKKAAILKKEIVDNQQDTTGGDVENAANYEEYDIPHEAVKQMSDEDQKAYKEHDELTYKIKYLEKDLKMAETLLKHLDDNKSYNLSLAQLESIEKGTVYETGAVVRSADGFQDSFCKGDISNAFPSYGDDKMTFAKTGKEIKEMLQLRMAEYESKKVVYMAKMSAMLPAIKEKGYEPESNDEVTSMDSMDSERMPKFSYKYMDSYYKDTEQADKDTQKAMRQYNDYAYAVESMCSSKKVAEIMIANLEDNKKYELNVRQIGAISKASPADEYLVKAKDSNKKVGKVMSEFKEGKLTSSSGAKVTDKKQALAIAMSEAGLEKDDTSMMIKKFNSAGIDMSEYMKKKSDKTSIEKAYDVLGLED